MTDNNMYLGLAILAVILILFWAYEKCKLDAYIPTSYAKCPPTAHFIDPVTAQMMAASMPKPSQIARGSAEVARTAGNIFSAFGMDSRDGSAHVQEEFYA